MFQYITFVVGVALVGTRDTGAEAMESEHAA